MSTLRNDMMDMLQHVIETNRENAAAQIKNNTAGLRQAIAYSERADAIEAIIYNIHVVLSKHGQ